LDQKKKKKKDTLSRRRRKPHHHSSNKALGLPVFPSKEDHYSPRKDKIPPIIIIYELRRPLGSNGKTPLTRAMTANSAAQTQIGTVVVAPFLRE
jgi:hypothetical protein